MKISAKQLIKNAIENSATVTFEQAFTVKEQPELTEEQFKEIVVAAISYCNFPVTEIALWAEEQGFAKFVGNEDNNQYAWVLGKLETLTLPTLIYLFFNLKRYFVNVEDSELVNEELASLRGCDLVEDSEDPHDESYRLRFTDALEYLCKVRPSKEIVDLWFTDPEDFTLQEFAVLNGPPKILGIGVIDAAHALASNPHETFYEGP